MTQTETNDNDSIDIPTATAIGTLSSSYPTTKSSQQWQGAVVSSPTTPISSLIPSSEEDGKGLGIALFVVLLVGILINIVLPPVSLVCTITAIVLSSILSCGCCCEYNLSTKRRKLANTILTSLCLMVILQVVSVSIWLSGFGYNVDQRVSIIIMLVLSYMLNITAIVLSAIFTWGKSITPRNVRHLMDNENVRG